MVDSRDDDPVLRSAWSALLSIRPDWRPSESDSVTCVARFSILPLPPSSSSVALLLIVPVHSSHLRPPIILLRIIHSATRIHGEHGVRHRPTTSREPRHGFRHIEGKVRFLLLSGLRSRNRTYMLLLERGSDTRQCSLLFEIIFLSRVCHFYI